MYEKGRKLIMEDLTKKLYRPTLGAVRLKTGPFRQFKGGIDIEIGQVNVFVGPITNCF